MGGDAYNTIKENLAKALCGERISFETSILYKDTRIRNVQPTYVPHFSDEGIVKGIFVLVTDITERKRLESQLLQRDRLATLGQMAATVSHELRNPLGVIQTSAFIVHNGLNEETPRVQRALERIERNVIRCDRIIGEMLDLTRTSEIQAQPTPINAWLEETFNEQTLPSGVALRRDFSPGDMAVSFDHDRFRRAVINVFDNACQAMIGKGLEDAGSEEHTLTVRTQERDGRVEMIFEDTGPGMPPDVYKRIFEPLYSTKGFGVGLGLPVVKQIMEQHGGGIEIESEEGRGSGARRSTRPVAP